MWRELIRLAAKTLWSNRLRSALTVLGTAVAVLAIVAVVSILNGADRYVAQQILTSGPDVFTLTKVGFVMDFEAMLEAQKRRDLELEDAVFLQDQLTLAAAVVPRVQQRLSVKRGREQLTNVSVWGTGADYPLVGDFIIEAGRDLGPLDLETRSSVAVIGAEVRERLFGNLDPIGQSIRIGAFRHVVVGVLEARGGGLGESKDELILIPITTLQKQFGSRQSIDIMVQAADISVLEDSKAEAALYLKLRRGLKPYDEPDFDIHTDEQVFAAYQNFTRLFYAALVGLVSLSLLIGGIVIMNIMLVSVTERTREIGLRKALGAHPKHIVAQFLVESVLLSLAGGLAGGTLGALVTWLVEALSPVPAQVQPWSVVVGLALAGGAGLFFGIYPAHRASRLSPIAALRAET
jgi:putative ABC transport system permease protein